MTYLIHSIILKKKAVCNKIYKYNCGNYTTKYLKKTFLTKLSCRKITGILHNYVIYRTNLHC